MSGLFDSDDYIQTREGQPVPVAELRRLHDEGAPLLEKLVPPGTSAIFRVRNAAGIATDPARLNEATVRVIAAGGAKRANEWQRLIEGKVDMYAYGWLDRLTGTLKAYIVVDAAALLEDIRGRPGCLVPATTRSDLLHRAPGGARFYVVDLRKIRSQTVLTSHGYIEWASMTAPEVSQESLL